LRRSNLKKKKKLTPDGRTMDAVTWYKFSWPSARWANNESANYNFLLPYITRKSFQLCRFINYKYNFNVY